MNHTKIAILAHIGHALEVDAGEVSPLAAFVDAGLAFVEFALVLLVLVL